MICGRHPLGKQNETEDNMRRLVIGLLTFAWASAPAFGASENPKGFCDYMHAVGDVTTAPLTGYSTKPPGVQVAQTKPFEGGSTGSKKQKLSRCLLQALNSQRIQVRPEGQARPNITEIKFQTEEGVKEFILIAK
jgi:hypothetical protein